jgi:predicted ATPase
MTKAVLEAGNEDAARWTAAAIPLSTLAVPASLQASLMARLDRLGSAKEVAQIGAAIGREFSHSLLSAVASKQQPQLVSALDRLIATGLLFRQGVPPHASYLFKHALVQDAAYSTLLREPRRALHARIAAILENEFSEVAENQPELLARHCTEAELIEKAIMLWGSAGQRSLRRSSFTEATQQFKAGLTLLDRLPKGGENARREIQLQTGLGIALTATRGYAAFETGQAYSRARQLCEEVGDMTALVRVGYGQYLYHLMAGEVHQSLRLANETLRLADKINDDDARVLGHRTLGVSLFELGQIADARHELELAANLFESRKKVGRDASASETRIMIWSWLAFLLTFQGHLADAFRIREIALREADAPSAVHTRATPMGFGAAMAYHFRDYQDFLDRAQAMYALADDQDLHFHKSIALMYLGLGRMRLGDNHARSVFRNGLSGYQSSGTRWALPCFLGWFACALPDKDEERTTVLDQAFDAVEATQERWYQAELYRLRGDLSRSEKSANNGPAEENYKTGKRIAEEQGSMLLNLRVTTSLATLWRDQGKREQARELLAPVYGWFTEGFDTRDLKEAKALLVELAS